MKKTLIKRIAAVMAAAVLAGVSAVPVFADAAPDGATDASKTAAAANGAYDSWLNEWSTISTDWTQVALTPGTDETQMNFSWYSVEGKAVRFKYGTTEACENIATISQSGAQTGYKSNKVTLKNLEPDTTYFYKVDDKDVETFTTKDSKSFSFIFVGDPQIGSSNSEKAKKPEDIAKDTFKKAQYDSVASDSFNWANTLNQAFAKTNSNASFVLSAGDQIQTNAKKVKDNTVSEIEYAGYLSPDILKSLPVATSVGNHDADNANYLYHFNIPNMSTLGANDYVGGDYSFTYGDALFMMLNTQDTDNAEHGQFIKETVEANPDAKWKIVTLHQDIYGSAEHSNEPEIVNLRYALVPYFEEYGIDVVLSGHDHAYSRSQILKGGSKEITYTDDEFDAQLEKDIDVGDSKEQITVAPGNISDDTTDESEKAYLEYLNTIMDSEAVVEAAKDVDVAVNPDGILYMTANSSSGSKYYDLVARQQTYIASRRQDDIPTYSVIDVDETSFTINTYRTDTNEPIDSQFTIVKSADKTDLKAEIEKIEALNLNKADYTEEGFEVLTSALEGAKAVLEDEKATSADVDNALAALKTAYSSLELSATEPSTASETTAPTGATDATSATGTAPTSTKNSTTTGSNGAAIKTGAESYIIMIALFAAIGGAGVFCYFRRKRDIAESQYLM